MKVEWNEMKYMSRHSGGSRSRVSQFPFLPNNLPRPRLGPAEEEVPDPRYDPQTVAKPLGLFKHEGLNRLILVLLSRIFSFLKNEKYYEIISPGGSSDKMTRDGKRDEKLKQFSV